VVGELAITDAVGRAIQETEAEAANEQLMVDRAKGQRWCRGHI